MNTERSWWKGSLPSWVGVALISVSMFAGRRLLIEHDRLIAKVELLGNRVIALEARVESLQLAWASEHESIHGPRSPDK